MRERNTKGLGVVWKVLASLILGVFAYMLWGLRTCGEQRDVPLGGIVYTLCGRSDDLIVSAPVDEPIGDVLYSWRDVDGNRASTRRLRYISRKSADELHQHFVAFLTLHKFEHSSSDATGRDGSELWRRDYMTIHLTVRPEPGRSSTQVVIDHNSGLD